MTLRVAELPDASVAWIAIVLNPTSSGTLTLHCAVPAAGPDWPKLFDHVTEATLPDAVPEKTIDAALVEAEVPAGEAMVNVGALPPAGALPPEDGAGAA